MEYAKTVRLQERPNGKHTVVAEVFDETERAWVRRSMGTFPWHEADLLKRKLEQQASMTMTDLDRQRMTVADALDQWRTILDAELAAGTIQWREGPDPEVAFPSAVRPLAVFSHDPRRC